VPFSGCPRSRPREESTRTSSRRQVIHALSQGIAASQCYYVVLF
jgi:hypothetical protein